MSKIAFYDENNNVTNFLKSADQYDFQGQNMVIDQDFSALENVPLKYWIHDNGVIREMTAQEKATKDQSISDSENAKKTTNVNNLDITIKDAFLAWLTVYNSKVPAQYQVTPLELKNKLLSDLGL